MVCIQFQGGRSDPMLSLLGLISIFKEDVVHRVDHRLRGIH
jgi:hypothetical protein